MRIFLNTLVVGLYLSLIPSLYAATLQAPVCTLSERVTIRIRGTTPSLSDWNMKMLPYISERIAVTASRYPEVNNQLATELNGKDVTYYAKYKTVTFNASNLPIPLKRIWKSKKKNTQVIITEFGPTNGVQLMKLITVVQFDPASTDERIIARGISILPLQNDLIETKLEEFLLSASAGVDIPSNDSTLLLTFTTKGIPLLRKILKENEGNYLYFMRGETEILSFRIQKLAQYTGKLKITFGYNENVREAADSINRSRSCSR